MSVRILPVPPPSPSIMLVDGYQDTRQLNAMVLADLGGTIVEAEDGAEALAIAMCQPPDVVVAEVALRRIDGFTLTRLLRREPLTCAAAIVLVTSSREASDIARAVDAGADEVIVKPYLPSTLLAAIDSAWRRRHRGSVRKVVRIDWSSARQ